LFLFTLVHARAYPVFAVMFGYGLVQLARRQEAAGAAPSRVRAVLLRRNAWLVAFGLVHGVLLYFGDFLGAYGLVGIIATVVLLQRGERVYRIVPWLWGASTVYVLVLAVIVAVQIGQNSGPRAGVPNSKVDSLVAPDYTTAVLDRLVEWPLHTATVLGFIVIVWLGMWAARRRVLEDPASNRKMLRQVAVGGLGIAFVGGLPLALVAAGMLSADSSAMPIMVVLHGASGMFAGPGYVALFGLFADRLSRAASTPRTPPVTAAVASLGQRSLSGYLFQSVVWLLVLSPYTLALGNRFGSPTLTAIGLALLVWLATVVGAWLLDRHSCPGPAEFLLRRLTYQDRTGVASHKR
jgi:uncharacterized membrane protein YeiB